MSLSFLPVVVVQPFFPQKEEKKNPWMSPNIFLCLVLECVWIHDVHTRTDTNTNKQMHIYSHPRSLRLRQVNEWDLLFNFALQHTHTLANKTTLMMMMRTRTSSSCAMFGPFPERFFMFLFCWCCVWVKKSLGVRAGSSMWWENIILANFPTLKEKVSSNTLAKTHTHTPSWAAKCKNVNMLNCGFFG